jgi:hypothetical protein
MPLRNRRCSLSLHQSQGDSRAVLEGKAKSRYLIVPHLAVGAERDDFLATLEQRATDADQCVAALTIVDDGSTLDGFAQYNRNRPLSLRRLSFPWRISGQSSLIRSSERQPRLTVLTKRWQRNETLYEFLVALEQRG